jgi:hypothetical protein
MLENYCMPSAPHVNKSIQDTSTLPDIDVSLKELEIEAKSLFQVLDHASNKIRKMETCLSELKAHFPFRYAITEELADMTPQGGYDGNGRFIPDCCDETYWCLAWEQDDSSRNYRLFLISEMRVVTLASRDNDGHFRVVASKVVFKKPLIETDLATRLHYFDSLNPFIRSFKNYLANRRISIEYKSFDDIPF